MVRRPILFLKHVDVIEDVSPSTSKQPKENSFECRLFFDNIKKIDDDMVIHISKDVKSIEDLIELSEMYMEEYRYNIDLYRLAKIRDPLIKLSNAVGLKSIKSEITKQIIYFLQEFNGRGDDMLHTVIQGPPGVGKTMVGEIVGEIYHKLGIIKGSTAEYKFKIKRSDLIGQYLGTTAKKTQDVINSCLGGVMFIDEAYSLGNEGKQDIYAKECIDTINQNLTELKGKFLCIIAGYEKDLNNCFFRYNEGLRRRFPFVYSIEKYDSDELVEIFQKMLKKDDWHVDISKQSLQEIFKKNHNAFCNMAGDIETLVFNSKLEHSSRVFCLDDSEKNKINRDDLIEGIQLLKKSRDTDSIEEERKREEQILNTLYV